MRGDLYGAAFMVARQWGGKCAPWPRSCHALRFCGGVLQARSRQWRPRCCYFFPGLREAPARRLPRPVPSQSCAAAITHCVSRSSPAWAERGWAQ